MSESEAKQPIRIANWSGFFGDRLGQCLDGGIKVVTNAGGLDPDGCADAESEVAAKLGLSQQSHM